MNLLFLCPPRVVDLAAWQRVLGELDPGIRVLLPDEAAPDDVDAAVVQDPPAGALRRYPRLRAIFSLGAGVEHLWSDPLLPDVPLVKMASPMKARVMAEYVLYAVLRHHRGFDALERQQATQSWRRPTLYSPLASERRVTVLGLGELGLAAAQALQAHGFRVAGWSRTPKDLPGIACHAGPQGLAHLLPETEILVSLLPLTPDTEGLLNARLFAQLPAGAAVINAGRGRQLVAADLVAALDRGHLSGATLDVVEPEPLPPGHPLWHPRIFVTVHTASYPPPHTAAPSLVENLHRLAAGQPLLRLVDRTARY